MKIAFVTTLSPQGSTNAGRVFPLARELAKHHAVHVLLLRQPAGQQTTATEPFTMHWTGHEPFTRSAQGKERQKGALLLWQLGKIAAASAAVLFRLKPDIVVVVKPLPHNVLGVWLWHAFHRQQRIVLDVDDFELAANVFSNLLERAAVHWAERTAAKLAAVITVATPFLHDHFVQLSRRPEAVHLLPTGLTVAASPLSAQQSPALLYIGSVSVSSGHRIDLLPDILRQVRQTIPDCRLTIAGSGDDVTLLQAALAAHGLTNAVTWTGRFTSHDIAKLTADHPIIVDPIDSSIANRAKSSFRAALAAASGLALVTSNIGIRPYHIPESLQPRFFAPPEDVLAYAQRIIALIQQPLTLQEREQLQSHAQQYAWHVLARQFAGMLTKS